VVLVFEEIHGDHPATPWTFESLRAVFAALDDVAAATTPCPITGLASFVEQHGSFEGFRRMAGGDPAVERLDPWSRRHLERLAQLEGQWEPHAAGDTLVHADVRADNLLVRGDGSVMIVDWPHACRGAAWLDKALMLPSVALDGGPTPLEVEETLKPFAAVEPDAVDAVLVGLCGYFLFSAAQPSPLGLPTVRAFQKAQGDVTAAWLAHRLDLP
jgi:aminoglycoside phosphotransferase (APT) family kinase protein